MDSNGNLYTVTREMVESAFTPVADLPVDSIAIDDPKVAESLAKLNRRARRIYFSERRHGASEADALGAAEGSYY